MERSGLPGPALAFLDPAISGGERRRRRQCWEGVKIGVAIKGNKNSFAGSSYQEASSQNITEFSTTQKVAAQSNPRGKMTAQIKKGAGLHVHIDKDNVHIRSTMGGSSVSQLHLSSGLI